MKLNLNHLPVKRNRQNYLIPIFIITLSISGLFIYGNLKNTNHSAITNSNPSNLLTAQNTNLLSDEKSIEVILPVEELRLADDWLSKIPLELQETEWLVVVDVSEQREYVFQNRKLMKTYIISTGSKDRYNYDATMPIGVWRIGEKIPYSLGEIYGPRLMYIEWWNGSDFERTLKALHGTNEPENLGKPTSLGCVYHANDDIIELFEMLPEGSLVLTIE